jgi:hypothetical protein
MIVDHLLVSSTHSKTVWVETSNTQKPNLMTPSLINFNQSSVKQLIWKVSLSGSHLSSAIDKIRAVHCGVIACVKMGICIQVVDLYFVSGKLIFPWSNLFHSKIPWPSQQLLLSRKWICPIGPKFVCVCIYIYIQEPSLERSLTRSVCFVHGPPLLLRFAGTQPLVGTRDTVKSTTAAAIHPPPPVPSSSSSGMRNLDEWDRWRDGRMERRRTTTTTGGQTDT